jgi:hypothetical protein
MWLNKDKIASQLMHSHRTTLLNTYPNHIVIDNLFDTNKLNEVLAVLQEHDGWVTQKHTYKSLYVSTTQWEQSNIDERFVKRDVWQRPQLNSAAGGTNVAQAFLSFLRSKEFMSLLSPIFNVQITDINVAKPNVNTNYFRLNANDFVHLHADDSPGRIVCMLLYLNKEWRDSDGGELVFLGKNEKNVTIAPLFNRCILFDPSSIGAEHWVNSIKSHKAQHYRYNVTSWYWSQ